MFTSSRYSYLALKLGLALVFIWFGVDKMLHPAYWLNAWVPQGIVNLIGRFGLGGTQFIYINGIFEILVGLGLITGVFAKLFSVLAIFFLVFVMIFSGINEITIRDLGLIGGFLSVVLWPSTRTRF